MCVGIGLNANYHYPYPGHYDYTSATFFFISNVGANGGHTSEFWPTDSYNFHICDSWWEIDSMMYSNQFDMDQYPHWNDETGDYYMWTQNDTHDENFGTTHASTVTGHTTQTFGFYNYVIVLEIYVYPEWDILTAQAFEDGPHTTGGPQQ